MAKATKLPSGNWRCKAYYTDEYGERKSKSFTAETKKIAEYMAQEYLIEREHAAKPENKTLGEMADSFLELNELLSPSTLRGYKSIRNNAFQSIINVRAGLLTAELYQKAINEYAQGRSAKTVISAHAFFNTVLNKNGYTIGNNATLPKMVKKEIEIPSTEEVQAFLTAIRGTRLYLYCLFSVCLGLRKSETIALQWSDINWAQKTVSINKAKVRNADNIYEEKGTKTFSGARTLHMPEILLNALNVETDKTGDIFKSTPKSLESLYQRQSKRHGFPYNFHALRHYYASVMLINGIPNKYAQERMGHASEDMLLKVYQHTFKTEEERHDIVLDTFFTHAFQNEKEERA